MQYVQLDVQREFNALAGLSSLAVRLYLILRRWMDKDTCTTGNRHKRISYQMLREECEVITPRGKGFQRTQPTIKEIRVALDGLKRAGLIQPIGDGELSFRLAQAARAQARPAQTGQSEGTVDNSNSYDKPSTCSHTRQTKPAKPGNHLGSIKNLLCTGPIQAGDKPATTRPTPPDAAAGFLDDLAKTLGYPIRHQKNDPHLKRWRDSGIPFDRIKEAAQRAKDARERDHSHAPLNTGFIEVFLKHPAAGIQKPAKGAQKGQKQARGGISWMSDDNALLSKAAELGIQPRPGESWAGLRGRVAGVAG